MKGIIGRKLGMTQVFSEDGILIPVTVVEVTPNIVLQKKTTEVDGYDAVQLGLEDIKEQRATKAAIAHAKKANTAPKRYIREMRGEDTQALEVGTEVRADIFEAGEIVDVIGTSKGKGYMGTIVRNNASKGPMSHGSRHHRHIGSLATNGITSRQGRIIKGTIMAGQQGGYRTTNQNLEIIKVDAENNYLLIKGNVPGPRKGMVIVQAAKTAKVASKQPVKLVDHSATATEEE